MKNTFKPKIGIMVIVLILIVSAVIMVAKRNEHTSLNSSASNSPTLAADAQKSGDIGEYYNGPSSNPATPLPSAEPLTSYKYPNATVKLTAENKLEMESTASANTITDWYKKKIESLKFNAKSVSRTNTNGNILNKITAAKPGEKIDITIKKDQTSTKVLITVDRT